MTSVHSTESIIHLSHTCLISTFHRKYLYPIESYLILSLSHNLVITNYCCILWKGNKPNKQSHRNNFVWCSSSSLLITCCAKFVLALASRVPANIVFLVLLMFLIFQILFLIHLVSVIKYVARHTRMTYWKFYWFIARVICYLKSRVGFSSLKNVIQTDTSFTL